MSNLDALSLIETKVLLNASVASNTTTSGAVFTIGNVGSDIVKVQYVISGRTDGTYTPLIQWSADGTTYVDVADAFLRLKNEATGEYTDSSQEANAALSANGVSFIGFVANVNFPYIKVSVVSTSVTTGAIVNIVASFSRKIQK